MKELKRVWIHLALLVVAALVAFRAAQPKDASDKPLAPGELELWKAKPEDVSTIVFEDENRTVTLAKQSDKVGTWYLGKVVPRDGAKAQAPLADPHAAPPAVEAATFAAVGVAKELAKTLSTLRAKRSFGPIGDDRLKEFGFDKPEGTLRVTIAGTEHALLVGASTAGSTTRYVRDVATKVVYVIESSPVSDLKAGAARLTERSPHEWKWNEPDAIAIAAGGKSKRVVRSGTEGRRFWADANTADQNDETSGNWLGKLERMRPTGYLEKLPEGAKKLARVEYRVGSEEKGFVELYLREDKESPFVMVTEQLRIPATVTRQVAEELVSDLATVLPGADLPAVPKDASSEPASPAASASASASAAASAAPTATASAAAGVAPSQAAPKKPGPSSEAKPK